MKIAEAKHGLDHIYAPHLSIRTMDLGAGREWVPQVPGWLLMQVGAGGGYWMIGQSRLELETGAVLVAPGDAAGRILASRIGGLALNFFTIVPERLAGLISQGEHDFLKQAAGRRELSCQLFPAANSVAVKMSELCARPQPRGLSGRLKALQVVAEIFGRELDQLVSAQGNGDVKERLRVFLQETPPAELLEITFEELARLTHCTPRHLSRVFYEVVGMSFRDKRAEIRLSRARELLATSQSKVVEVAYKSGYRSLSLFNRMFAQRFGTSPGRWRQKYGENGRGGHEASLVKKSRPGGEPARARAF